MKSFFLIFLLHILTKRKQCIDLGNFFVLKYFIKISGIKFKLFLGIKIWETDNTDMQQTVLFQKDIM